MRFGLRLPSFALGPKTASLPEMGAYLRPALPRPPRWVSTTGELASHAASLSTGFPETSAVHGRRMVAGHARFTISMNSSSEIASRVSPVAVPRMAVFTRTGQPALLSGNSVM